MQVNRTFIILFFIFLAGCIDPFSPKISENQEALVIEGNFLNKEGYQEITISRSSDYNVPMRNFVEGCLVEVIDGTGVAVQYIEEEPGHYKAWINRNFASVGKTFQVHVLTPDGKEYLSTQDTMLSCPPIESLYYEIERRETKDPDFPIYGIQFYTDLYAPQEYASHFRIGFEETWEYNTPYLIQYYYVGYIVDLGHETDSLHRCWFIDIPVHEIYTVTNSNLDRSKTIRGIPLLYVSNETNRLKVAYSLLMTQYSLTEQAYNYWEEIRKQSQESGGLYEYQPYQIRGNIFNVDDSNEDVLGYFFVSALTQKRIFVSELFDFNIQDYNCKPIPLGISNPLGFYGPSEWPVYLTSDRRAMAPDVCFDCTATGASLEKPDYWPF
jgi:hypothetical protein